MMLVRPEAAGPKWEIEDHLRIWVRSDAPMATITLAIL